MRRTTGAIFIDTRPESNSSPPAAVRPARPRRRSGRCRSAGLTSDIISIAQQARPKVDGKIELGASPADRLPHRRRHRLHRRRSRSRSGPSRSPRSRSLARSCRTRRSVGERGSSRGASRGASPASPPIQRPPTPHVDQRHHQQDDEDDQPRRGRRLECAPRRITPTG